MFKGYWTHSLCIQGYWTYSLCIKGYWTHTVCVLRATERTVCVLWATERTVCVLMVTERTVCVLRATESTVCVLMATERTVCVFYFYVFNVNLLCLRFRGMFICYMYYLKWHFVNIRILMFTLLMTLSFLNFSHNNTHSKFHRIIP